MGSSSDIRQMGKAAVAAILIAPGGLLVLAALMAVMAVVMCIVAVATVGWLAWEALAAGARLLWRRVAVRGGAR